MIPSAKMENCSKFPPEKRLMMLKMPPAWDPKKPRIFSMSTPGWGM